MSMARAWRPLAALDTRSVSGSQVQLILSTANFEHLAGHALQIRAATDPDLIATFDCSRYAAGRNNLVLELKYSDGISWILRVPLEVNDDTSTSMLSEVTTIKLVRQRTTIPVARMFAFEATSGIFGFPYMLMKRLPGALSPKGLSVVAPEVFHPKVAEQIADVIMQLSGLTFDSIGRLIESIDDGSITILPNDWHPKGAAPMKSSLEYFYGDRYQVNLEISKEHPKDDQWKTACWILTAALAHIVIPDRTHGPFPLCHMNLWWGNMLWDEEWNLTGIIDWSGAQTAPFEQLSVLPDFMLCIGSLEPTRDVAFKNLLVKALANLESSQPLGITKLSSFLASNASEIYGCYYMNSTVDQALICAQEVADMMYRGSVTWEQLVTMYSALTAPGLFGIELIRAGKRGRRNERVIAVRQSI